MFFTTPFLNFRIEFCLFECLKCNGTSLEKNGLMSHEPHWTGDSLASITSLPSNFSFYDECAPFDVWLQPAFPCSFSFSLSSQKRTKNQKKNQINFRYTDHLLYVRHFFIGNFMHFSAQVLVNFFLFISKMKRRLYRQPPIQFQS